jgi:hypothetical protein
MSFLSKITGKDRRTEKRKLKEAEKYGGGVGTQYLEGMKTERDMSGSFEQDRVADRSGVLAGLEGGQKALEASTMAAMSAAMPSLFKALQGTKESNIRRGLYNGETPTSYEGDVMSAFQGNIADSVAGQSMNLWDRQQSGREHLLDLSTASGFRARENYYDLIAGKLDRDQAKRQAKAEENAGIAKGIGSIVGGIFGSRGK